MIQFSVLNQTTTRSISMYVVTSQLNVGGLIAKSALGGLDATITANGAIEGGNIVAQVDAAVDRFRLGGYTYSDIDIWEILKH